jgi:hypothetical protein
LVVSGQMSRDEAITMLAQDSYPDPLQKREDRYFVLKKLGFTETEFNEYLARPQVPHCAYPSELNQLATLSRAWKAVRRMVR